MFRAPRLPAVAGFHRGAGADESAPRAAQPAAGVAPGGSVAGMALWPVSEAARVLRAWRDHADRAPDQLASAAAIITAPPQVRPRARAPAGVRRRSRDLRRRSRRGGRDGPADQGPRTRPRCDHADAVPRLPGAARRGRPVRYAQLMARRVHGRPARRSDRRLHRTGGQADLAVQPDDHLPHRTGRERRTGERDRVLASRRAIPPSPDLVLGEDRVRDAYGPEKHERLVALKDKYDPENLFRLNHNIKPSGRPREQLPG